MNDSLFRLETKECNILGIEIYIKIHTTHLRCNIEIQFLHIDIVEDISAYYISIHLYILVWYMDLCMYVCMYGTYKLCILTLNFRFYV